MCISCIPRYPLDQQHFLAAERAALTAYGASEENEYDGHLSTIQSLMPLNTHAAKRVSFLFLGGMIVSLGIIAAGFATQHHIGMISSLSLVTSGFCLFTLSLIALVMIKRTINVAKERNQNDFIRAVFMGNNYTAKQFLNLGEADINKNYKTAQISRLADCTALLAAVRMGNVTIISELLKFGAALDATINGNTLFHEAGANPKQHTGECLVFHWEQFKKVKGLILQKNLRGETMMDLVHKSTKDPMIIKPYEELTRLAQQEDG